MATIVGSAHGSQEDPLLSQATVHNDTVYVSGQTGMDLATRQMVIGDVADRARQIILNLQAVLEKAGSGLDKILKANIYLNNMHNYAAVNRVWMEMIPNPKPARTCVAVNGLPMGTDVEVDCIATI